MAILTATSVLCRLLAVFQLLRHPASLRASASTAPEKPPRRAPEARRLEQGRKIAANATLLVAGLVRNAQSFLPKLRRRLESLATHFLATRIAFVENDSSDGTRAYLRKWAKQARGRVSRPKIELELIEEDLASQPSVGAYANRGDLKAKGWGHDGVRLLARLRNRYLDEMRAHVSKQEETIQEGSVSEAASPPNYLLLMVDADVGDNWNDEAVLEALGHEARWDVLCSHTWYRPEKALYDAFALRSPQLQPFAEPEAFERDFGRSFFPHAMCGTQKRWGGNLSAASLHQISEDGPDGSLRPGFADGSALLPVESCFGGLALYREDVLRGSLAGCRYDEDVDDCEHVEFHRCLRSKGAAVTLSPDWQPRASASDTTCCVETCSQADSYPLGFLPFEPQFVTSNDFGQRTARLLAAGMDFEERGDLQGALGKYLEAGQVHNDLRDVSTEDLAAAQRWAARGSFAAAFLLLQHRQPDESLRLLLESPGAEGLAAADPRAALMLGHVYELLDELGSAEAWFTRAVRGHAGTGRWPEALLSQQELEGAKLKAALAVMPVTHETADEASEAVAKFIVGISLLIAGDACGKFLQSSVFAGFDTRSVETVRLAYLGPALVPHLPELASVYSRLHLRSLVGLGYVAPALRRGGCLGRAQGRQRPRIGFLSGLFGDSAVGNMARGIITPLPQQALEVILVVLGTLRKKGQGGSQVIDALVTRADKVEELSFWPSASPGNPEELRRARSAISDLELDVLVFLEVGLDVRSFVLAHSRLAPVQLATYGHASTTGVPTIDFFVTHEAFEPSDSSSPSSRYSERLVILPGLPYFLPSTPAEEDSSISAPTLGSWQRWRSILEKEGATQAALPDLGPRAHVYLIAQTLYKVVPEFDVALLAILRADARAVVAIRAGHPQPVVHRRIGKRLASQLTAAEAARVRFLPMQDAEGYFWILRHADVVLDPFPHGGHTTTLDALSAGVPVMSLWTAAGEAGHLAGGFARGFFQELSATSRAAGDAVAADMLETCCVAANVTDYVSKAMKLAHDSKHREKVRMLIRRWAPPAVFGRKDASEAWGRLLVALAGEVTSGLDNSQDSGGPVFNSSLPGASCVADMDGLWEYLQKPEEFLWHLFPMILRPRAVLRPGPPKEQWVPRGSHSTGAATWLAFQDTAASTAGRWWIAGLRLTTRRRAALVMGPFRLREMTSKKADVLPELQDLRIVSTSRSEIWAFFRRGGSQQEVLGRILLVPGSRRALLLPRANRAPAAAMGVRSLGPQFVWTGELHRSFAKALAGHVGLEPVFCCASLSGSQLEDLVPQMQDQVSRQSSSSQRAWLLGLARRSKGLPKLQKKNLNMGEVQDAVTPPLHALYLLAPERHMRLAAISAEFCIASDGLRPARRILWDASYTPEGMLGPGGTGLGACDPLGRAVGLGIWGQHRVNSSSDLRLALVLQTGPTGKLLVADFPASILGPLLHPLRSDSLGPRVRVSSRR